MNRNKITGILLCSIGVGLARFDSFISVTDSVFFILKTLGILLALTGLAFFGSGMKKVIKKVKACPQCFKNNDISASICKKCKKPLFQK